MEREGGGRHFEHDALGAAGRQGHLRECLQLLDGTHDACDHVADVELHDFGPRPITRVGQVELDPEDAFSGDPTRGKLQAVVSELRVAEPVPERIQSGVGPEDVVPFVRRGMPVVVDRYLADIPREGHG